jgi:adenylate kinase
MIQNTCVKVMRLHSTSFNNFSSKQKFLFLFGAPGVGKGTYAKFIAKDLKFNHISTGDEIRKIIKGKASNTFDKKLVAEIKEIVNAGKLVSDDIVVSIIREKIKEPESKNGVILDGFPRTLSQLTKYDAIGLPTHLVVNLTLKQSVLLEKLTARRHCNECGQSFNIVNINRDGYLMDPLLPTGPCVAK